MNNKFYGIFWNALIFGGKIKNFKICKKKHRYSEIIGNAHLFILHNEPSLMPIGWKLWEEKALKWQEMSLFRRAVYSNVYYRKINNYT